jgi:hypothetical protein
VLTAEELEARREAIAAGGDLTQLLDRLVERAQPVLARMPTVPAIKALLTADGGVCPDDGTRLSFDPWSPTDHRCPRCGRRFSGERHEAAWAHHQHLWLAERAAHLAVVGILGERPDAVRRADDLLRAYRSYPEFPNQDNVLGPSRLFFSTYLESIWLANYLAAAVLLRETGGLSEETAEVVSSVADESAGLIGEFDEGLSNRQTWHNAALASVAVWFEDEELATRAIEGSSGILAHLLQGFGPDGMWFEGDNYHLFALRGQLLAMRWAQQAGVNIMADPRLAARVAAALRAPATTALPDFTFPARKDSRFGVSLAQPMYLELWEVGLARLQQTEPALELWDWLGSLYHSPAPPAQTFDSYLHEAGEAPPERPRTRADLSWWSLLEMMAAVPEGTPKWIAKSTFLEGQGLAILRSGDRYASVECGPHGGGHGHPDRLNLVLHANGEYWLPDFGTGSYVSRDLFWYRSTLAHNAPRLDGASQPPGDALCDNFDQAGGWDWVRGRFGEVARTVVSGPTYLLDVVELAGSEDRSLELPFHLMGTVEVQSHGQWQPDDLVDQGFVQQVERFVPDSPGALLLRSCGASGASLSAHLLLDGDLIRAVAPGAPGSAEPAIFYVARARGRRLRLVTVLESPTGQPVVQGVRTQENAIEVETTEGVDRHFATAEGWEVRAASGIVRLRGARQQPKPFQPLVQMDRPDRAQGTAVQLADAPELNGTLEGFDVSEPLELDHDDQYRRSEEAYPGPEEFSARAYVNWNDDALYLAVEVTKPEVLPRNPSAPPLRLDNEPDEIHSDGIQVYVRRPGEETMEGWLLALSEENGGLIVRPVGDTPENAVRGNWHRSEEGYTITAAITPSGWSTPHLEDAIEFDLLINRMLPARTRRAGQLVWSGGGGWVWLRGDRQDPARLGTLELR